MSNSVLSRWGVICVHGEEAAQFLHTQLSNSIKDLPENKVRLAAFCNAKGRMLGTFFVIRQADHFYLICRSNTIPALSKRLSMFILRSKCKAVDASSQWNLHFVPSALTDSTNKQPMSAVWDGNDACTLALRSQNGLTPGLRLIRSDKDSPNASIPQAEEDERFELALHKLGIPYVSAETAEMFIPQAINFDLIGGVNFEKGCYPGQEIVARSHYLGKSKRRAFLATLQGGEAILAGMDVWLNGKTNEPIGNVITAVNSAGLTYLMVDCGLEEALNPDSSFTIAIESNVLTLKLTPPPYNIQEKGSQFND